MKACIEGFLKHSLVDAGVDVGTALSIIVDLENPNLYERHFNHHFVCIDRHLGIVDIQSEIDSPSSPNGTCRLSELLDAIRALRVAL